MNKLMFRFPVMDESPGNGGEGGGGGNVDATSSSRQGEGDPSAQTRQDAPSTGEGEGDDKPNALGEELNQGGDKPNEQQPGGEQKPQEQQPDPNAPTEEESKAYKDALKLDEEAFGKDQKFDERYVERLPALFKKHGIAPDKANALANDFAKMQKEVEKDTAAKITKYREWRNGELKKMNDAYLTTYDKAGRDDIARAITHYFPKGSPMYGAICQTEVGVDPGFLKAMKDLGARLPKNGTPGAAAGAGAGGAKSLSDSFMGL